MHNPSGDIDIARLDDVQVWQPKIYKNLFENRGIPQVDDNFAYFIGKKGTWVRRVALSTFKDCGIIAFNPPYETSRHNKLSIQVFGKPKKYPNQTRLFGEEKP